VFLCSVGMDALGARQANLITIGTSTSDQNSRRLGPADAAKFRSCWGVIPINISCLVPATAFRQDN
jgi:hypothetical protein